ncbi:DUF302 domain-containing protein [Jongsikchunia kroppenstedtii]|uniref:DUF302 domain-containing protein n=1 Tax=Jongsikchunia kroppenstedtii TaxID=1121721 RepID=UPI0003676AAA|nr:DUF302 domain-containing protein [Jongsikchunia kroppenstedtii]
MSEATPSTEFTLTRTVPHTYAETVRRVREELAEVGFGILTEIDMAATLKAKLDVDTPPKVILGACRPQLAHQAVEIDPRIATLLPCNVVVTAVDSGSVIDVLDPMVMPEFTGNDELTGVAQDARDRLLTMLDAVTAMPREA